MLVDLKNIISKVDYDIGFYAVDMEENVVAYNEHKVFETASCIKLFILIEYYKQVYENKIKIDDMFVYCESDNIPGVNSGIISSLDYGLKLTSKDYATLMIIYSDNIATNKLIDYLGIDNINKTINDLGFKNTKLFNKLDLLKYFKLGQTTPYEYSRAYKMILNNEVINKEVSQNILEILKKQKHNDMLTKGLPQMDILFKGTENSIIKYIASKSGSIVYTGQEMKNCRNDGGIISTVYGDYIISIFISNIKDLQCNYDNEGLEFGANIGKIIFDEFIKNKGVLK